MRKLRFLRAFAFLQQLLLLSGLCAICLLLDLALAVSLCRGYLPIVLMMAISCSLGTFLMGMRRLCLLLFGLSMAILLPLPYIDLNATKPLARFCFAIQPGMTLMDVDRLLNQHFPANGRYPKPLVSSRFAPWIWIDLGSEVYDTGMSNNVGCDMGGPGGTVKVCYLGD